VESGDSLACAPSELAACGGMRGAQDACQFSIPRAANHRNDKYSALQKLIFRKSGNNRNLFENSI